MKLCRFGNAGDEKPGAIDADGRIRDLSGVIADLGPAELAPERLRALAAIDLATLPLVAATERLGPPLPGPRQFLAIGLNYSAHARDSGMDIRSEEPRVGTECDGTCKSRGCPAHSKKQHIPRVVLKYKIIT